MQHLLANLIEKIRTQITESIKHGLKRSIKIKSPKLLGSVKSQNMEPDFGRPATDLVAVQELQTPAGVRLEFEILVVVKHHAHLLQAGAVLEKRLQKLYSLCCVHIQHTHVGHLETFQRPELLGSQAAETRAELVDFQAFDLNFILVQDTYSQNG